MIKRWPLIPTILVALAVAVMIGLGIWQLRRAEWKEAMLARYTAAQGLPPIAFPIAPLGGEPPLFRRASGHCLQPVSSRVTAGRNRAGASGYSHIVECRTGAEGPGMSVDIGWSLDPKAGGAWRGGEVSGIIAPDRLRRMRLVADRGLAGLEASAPPSIDQIPNNHRAYAVQWFLFAGIAALIYALALRNRRRVAAKPPTG